MANRMMKFMTIATIGVPKEPQLRAAKILSVISDSCRSQVMQNTATELLNFFEFNKKMMTERWEKLREVLKNNELIVLQKYPLQYCHFFGDFIESHPGTVIIPAVHFLIYIYILILLRKCYEQLLLGLAANLNQWTWRKC